MTVDSLIARAAAMEAHDRIVLLVAMGVNRLSWIEAVLVEQHDYPADYIAALVDAMLAAGTLTRHAPPFDLVALR